MTERPGYLKLVKYFFTLGLTGFGGPIALANAMRRGRDLVDRVAGSLPMNTKKA